MMFRKNDGFTLVELMLTIAIGSLITLAATTTLLLGLRIHAKNAETIVRQNTTNMLVQVLENIAERDKITVLDENKITDIAEEKVYLEHDSENQEILLNGHTFMENVTDFKASFKNQLLTVTISTNEGTYTASKYCRLNPITQDNEQPSQP